MSVDLNTVLLVLLAFVAVRIVETCLRTPRVEQRRKRRVMF